jgi:hypothetical protein
MWQSLSGNREGQTAGQEIRHEKLNAFTGHVSESTVTALSFG